MDAGKVIGTIIAVVILAAAFTLMLRSWRRREVRDGGLAAYPLPAAEGATTFGAEVLYVATTPAADPLDRLAIAGLAFRGTARVRVEAAGVELRVAGEQPVWLPAEAVAGAERATWTIDRAVEPGGLVAITWLAQRAGETVPEAVTSALRARTDREATRLIEAVQAIAAAEVPATEAPEDAALAASDTPAAPAADAPAASGATTTITTESEA